MQNDQYSRKGFGIILVEAENLDAVRADGDLVLKLEPGQIVEFQEFGRQIAAIKPCLLVGHHNAYVNTGLNNSLDREFGLGGFTVSHIGVSNNSAAVTATTTFLNGASAGTAANTIIKAISPAPTRSNQTVTAGATFSNSDFTSGVFVWNKIGLMTGAADNGTTLIDVIGGTGGTAPYNRTFVLDLTGAGTFTVVAQIAVTAVAA